MARMFKPLQRYFTFWQHYCSIAMLSSVAWRDDAESEEEEKTDRIYLLWHKVIAF